MKIEAKWVFRALILAGAVYVWGMIPGNFRPRIPNSPISKGRPTITVDVDSPGETTVPWHAVGQVEKACAAPILLRPLMGDADKVEVLLRYQTTIVKDVTVPCPKGS